MHWHFGLRMVSRSQSTGVCQHDLPNVLPAAMLASSSGSQRAYRDRQSYQFDKPAMHSSDITSIQNTDAAETLSIVAERAVARGREKPICRANFWTRRSPAIPTTISYVLGFHRRTALLTTTKKCVPKSRTTVARAIREVG